MRKISSIFTQEQQRPLVLVADDDFISAEIMRSALSELYTVHIVKNGKEAVRATEILRPDLVIMDEIMPEMSGSTALYLLKKNSATADIPIIIMTGLNDVRDEASLLQTGACDYIIKPVSRSRLLARVRLQMTLKREKSDLHTSAYHDNLSGLKNRHGFTREVSHLINDDAPVFPMSISMIDIDNFKNINDTFGHDTGDKIISHLGQIMLNSEYSTKTTQYFRIGGDEFISISRGINRFEIEKKLSKIAHTLNTLTNQRISLSAGVSIIKNKLPTNIDIWIKHADMLLYDCKKFGRNKTKSAYLTGH